MASTQAHPSPTLLPCQKGERLATPGTLPLSSDFSSLPLPCAPESSSQEDRMQQALCWLGGSDILVEEMILLSELEWGGCGSSATLSLVEGTDKLNVPWQGGGRWLPLHESLFVPHKDGLPSYSHILPDGGQVSKERRASVPALLKWSLSAGRLWKRWLFIWIGNSANLKFRGLGAFCSQM